MDPDPDYVLKGMNRSSLKCILIQSTRHKREDNDKYIHPPHVPNPILPTTSTKKEKVIKFKEWGDPCSEYWLNIV
jgi:hypothetical protein